MIFKSKKMAEIETEVEIETPAYFTDGFSSPTFYKVDEKGIVGISLFFDGTMSLLSYSNPSNVIHRKKISRAEFEQVKEQLIKYLETI